MDFYAVKRARRACPACDRESQAAQHARCDLTDVAQPQDADPLVERRVGLLERVPAPGDCAAASRLPSRRIESAARQTYSPMVCAVSSVAMRTIGTPRGRSGSQVMWSTP